MLGILLSEEEYEEYLQLKQKNTPKRKSLFENHKFCPICAYMVDNAIPPQNYCDRCGQRLINQLEDK